MDQIVDSSSSGSGRHSSCSLAENSSLVKAPKVGGLVSGSVASSSSSSNSYNGVGNSPSKRSSEISAVVGRYNEAAGSNVSGLAREMADNSFIGFGQLAKGMDSNNGQTNNNKPQSSSPSSSSHSYSKIFLQYLPYTLNLNSKRAAKEHSSGQREKLNCSFGEKVGEKWSVCDSVASNQQKSSSSSQSKGLAGALSRFKISSSSSHNQQQQQQYKSHSKQVKVDEEEEALFGGERGTRFSSSSSAFQQHDCQLNLQNKQISVAEKNDNNNNNFESTSRKEQSCGNKIKRKGFLYLKKKNNNNNNFEQSLIKQEILIAEKLQQVQESRVQKVRSVRKTRDLNNNSICSNLLGSSSGHHQQDEEHNRCLLDCEEDNCEEENLATRFFGERVPQEVSEIRKQTNRISEDQFQIEAIRSSSRSNEMSPKMEESTKQTNNNNNNNRYIMQKKSSRASSVSSDSKALILTAGLVLVGLCAFLSANSGKFGALAQQQQQQPFSRSQRGPGGSLSAAALPPTNGAQSAVSGGVPGAGANGRPAPQPAAGSLVANINCNKIRGHVTLTPNLQGGTTVTTQISAGPPGEVYQWSVHQFPVKPGAAMCSCSPMILGSKLIDLSEMHGNLPSDQEFNVQSSLNLFGSESPVGHSLLLRGMKTGMVACATFLPTSRKSNYRAKFHSPISGSVTIFQTAFGTSFISHLMYSNGTRRHSMHRFDLVKSEDDMVTTSLLSGIQVGSPMSAGSSRAESLALEQREHEHELTQCRRYAQGEPLFRNMSYQLAVSTENFGMRGRTAMVLPQIPFETFASVFVIVYSEMDPSEPMACAPLKFVKPKTAAAKFQSVSVQGSVLFSQDSPYDVTVARINLNLPNSDGHSYGIDELPMIIRRKSDTRVCPNIREIIYNPHHVEPSSVPPEGEATSDQYAVGDLSGKYGSLTGKASEKIQVNDYNLPLYGPVSIVGRAMTIYSAEGVAIACSNVELTTPMTTAFATFDYGIQGQFIFRQPVNDCNGDTYVYIEVSKPVVPGATTATSSSLSSSAAAAAAATASITGSQDRSVDHNWHIHVSPVDSGLDHLSTTDCLPAGQHFNPYNTSTSSIYSRDCSPFNVFRCELGDMSGKMFTIEIPPYRVKGAQEPDIGKFFGTDIDLPLCGPVSIVNRSVVVHAQDFGHQRLACSTVIEFKPRTS